MTTFQSRELVRDELAALFTANGTWSGVFQYEPAVSDVDGLTPFLIIRSRGTGQTMESLNMNPSVYRFIISSWVISGSPSDSSVTSALAEDKLDECDKVLRQIIRDNTGNLTTADILEFDPNPSTVTDTTIGGTPYIVETRVIFAHLVDGDK